MKDATGELSTTVIAVVAIAAIAAIFTAFLLPQLKSSIILNQACSNGPGYEYVDNDGKYGVGCTGNSGGNNTTWTCYYQEKKGDSKIQTAPKNAGNGIKSKQCQQ